MKSVLDRFILGHSLSQVHATGAVVVGAIVLATCCAAIPAWQSHAERNDLSVALEATDARLTRTRQSLDAANHQLKSLSDTAAAARNELASLDKRLVDISSIAAQCGLTVDSVEPGGVTKNASGETATAVSATGHGSYLHVLQFVAKLRTDAPDLALGSIQLIGGTNDSCTFRLSVNWCCPPAGLTVATANGGDGR